MRARGLPGREGDRMQRLLNDLMVAGGADTRLGDHVGAAVTEWRRLPRIQVAGRAHSGRSTLLGALALMSALETDPVDAPGAPDPVLDADIVLYVLAGTPTAADRRVLGELPAARTVVVLNKADSVGSRWADAVVAADRIGRDLGMSTLPVIASLAARTRSGVVTAADLVTLRRHAVTADPAFTLSPELFTSPAAGPDVAERVELLSRWDLYGVACALTAVRHDPDIAPTSLLQLLYAASGVEPLHHLVHLRYERVQALRGGDLLDTLTRLAARAIPSPDSHGRALLEDFLAGDQASWLGLCAGLACPDVAHLAAGYANPSPVDADDAIARATRWRAVVSGEMSPAARRAALRVHNGYIRLWDRLSGAGL
ncbi:hypothetical protein D5S18_11345 [Nocardia panacis]|uniref:GTPase n=2 Tax=Nocardia panacis TaxID=2340916 RepID=A0A3A4K7Y4_9NOCA|nr:hypothetical protein D5S18_11345 [Nocardia panacis]